MAMGRQHIHECVKAHSELVDRCQEANRSWLDHLQSEADLSAEFASKMIAARSIPDVAALLLEWNKRHMEMAKVDTKHVVADTQKIMEIGVRLVPGIWRFNGTAAGARFRQRRLVLRLRSRLRQLDQIIERRRRAIRTWPCVPTSYLTMCGIAERSLPKLDHMRLLCEPNRRCAP